MREFEVYARNVEQLIRLQVEDPNLAPSFKWDARRMSKWDGDKWEQFWEAEPVQGSMMWDTQVKSLVAISSIIILIDSLI